MVLMGVANAAVQLGRFAAAEVNRPEHRGRAISNVVIGGTVGSVVGPFVAGPAGSLIGSWGIDELAGAYLVSLVLFVIAAVRARWRLAAARASHGTAAPTATTARGERARS